MKRLFSVLIVFLCIFSLLNGCGGGGNASSAPTVPTINWPAPAAITYGTALSATQLNATANYPGTFSYTPASGTVLSAGTQSLNAAFTPSDSSKVASATATNSLTVNKATPTVSAWPTASAITSGQTLAFSKLSGGAASTPGSFVFTTPSTSPGVGASSQSVTFTPSDVTDYNTVSGSVSVTVQAAGLPSYSWTNVRIVAGGYVTGVYYHPTQQNLTYIRTDIGGIYRRGPNDTQWVPLLDFMSRDENNWTGSEALGLDPTNPNNLYVAVGLYDASWSGKCAMLVSNDQGVNFTTVPLNFQCGSNEPGRGTGDRIAVDPNLPSTVYYGTRDNGLQISTDSGSTWNQMSGLSVTTSNPDNGWTESDGVVSVLPIASSASGKSATPVVYAVVAGTGTSGTSQGFYVTTNGGTTSSTWTAVSGQPSFTLATTPLAPLEGRRGPDGSIYILYGDQAGPDTMTTSQLWKFVPGSNWTSGTWTQITLPANLYYGSPVTGSQGFGGLAVDPSNAGHLLVGTLDQYWPTGDVVYRSTDDGKTWRDVSSVNTGGQSQSPNLATHDNTIAPYFGKPGTVSTGNWATGIAIDPFNADHAMYTFGGGLWITSDLTKADPSASRKESSPGRSMTWALKKLPSEGFGRLPLERRFC